MNLHKNLLHLLVLALVLSISSIARSQDASAAKESVPAAALDTSSASGSSDSSSSSSDTIDAPESVAGSSDDAVGSSSSSGSSSSGDLNIADVPAVAAAPAVATITGASRPGIPRLGSGYLLEQFRNYNLPGRLRGWTERIRNLRLGERARQFRAGIRINPDSLAYRTGRRFTLTLQGLMKRIGNWGERVRARQGQTSEGAAAGTRQNEISVRR